MTIRVLLADDQPLVRTALDMVITDAATSRSSGRPRTAPKRSGWPRNSPPTSW